MDGRTAAPFQRLCKFDRLYDVPAAPDPIRCGQAHGDRAVRRKGSTNGVEHFEREAHAVFQASAIFVGPPVGERRQELVQQIAVSRVDLHGREIQPCRTYRCVRKGSADPIQINAVKLLRRILALGKRNGGGRHRLPAILLTGRDLRSSEPRLVGRGLAARMAELDGDRHVRPAPHALQHL